MDKRGRGRIRAKIYEERCLVLQGKREVVKKCGNKEWRVLSENEGRK